MAEREPAENTRLYEIGFWRETVRTTEWKYYQNLLLKHKQYLERQVLIHTSNRAFDKAFGSGERADECGKILQLVTTRIRELSKEEK